MADSIKTVAGRSRLKPRRPPYWERIGSGCAVGFRKMTADSEGTWLAQFYDPATRKQTRRSLGAFSEVENSQRFDAARKAADEWFLHMGRGGSTEVVSVKRACELYVQHLRDSKREDTATDAEARFKRWVYSDKIGPVELPKLKRQHVEDWRRRMSASTVTSNPKAEESERKIRERSPATINREMSTLRAALNHAQSHGHVTTDAAWSLALKPIESADGRRDVYLTQEQRRALVDAAQEDMRPLLRGLCLVPLRPGALAELTAAQYDRRLHVLTVGKDKAGRDRKLKLPPATSAFFSEVSKGKLPGAYLFTRADGVAWNKDSWKWPIKEAAKAAELPEDVVAYALRHSTITDLVVGGLDLLTVAQLSGTSVAMIERHYGHLRAEHAAKALSQLTM